MTDNEKHHDKHKYEGQMKGLSKGVEAVKPDAAKLAAEKVDSLKAAAGVNLDQAKIDQAKKDASDAIKGAAERISGSASAKPATATPVSGGTSAAKTASPVSAVKSNGSSSSKPASASGMMASPSRPAAKPSTPASRPSSRPLNLSSGRRPWFWRVMIGYGLSCLAGAATLAAYFLPNADLAGAKPQEVGDWIEQFVRLSGLSWPLIAVFAAPFALIGLGVAESRKIRDWIYYVLLAIAVSVIGFLAKYGVEPEGATRTFLNNYAIMAFLSAGLVAGMVYWMISGRKA